MNQDQLFPSLYQWVMTYHVNLLISCTAFLAYAVLTRWLLPKIESGVDQGRFKSELFDKARHTIRLISGTMLIAALMFIWGFDFGGLLLISTSLLTLTGVALFASWSLLSNITAFFVLLMHHSYRRGNYIRVLMLDNFVEGYIADINLFNTRLVTDDREVIIYPNNLLLGQPTIINPRRHFGSLGRISDFAPPPVDPANDISAKTSPAETVSPTR